MALGRGGRGRYRDRFHGADGKAVGTLEGRASKVGLLSLESAPNAVPINHLLHENFQITAVCNVPPNRIAIRIPEMKRRSGFGFDC